MFRLLVLVLFSVIPLFAQANTVTLLHFNDLHAHLTPHMDLVAENGKAELKEKGGIARLATLIQQIRRETPSAFLMNIGDTYHGGVEAMYTNGNAVSAAVNALGIDVGVPGNWDYAYGPMVVRLRYTNPGWLSKRMLENMVGKIERPNFPNLAANVTYTMPAWKKGDTFLPPTMLKDINGVKVGFIGITTDILSEMHEMLALGLNFTQGEHDYRKLIESHASRLRSQGAQIVVVMSELGIHKDIRLADIVSPGSVDVFFSAHTHELTFKPLVRRSGALVVEAGNDGWLGRMDIEVSPGSKPVFHWKVYSIDSTLAEDPRVQALVTEARAPFLKADPALPVPMMQIKQTLHESIDTVVGHTDTLLHRRNSLDSTFNDTWADALRKYAGTQLAMTPGFRFDAVSPSAGMEYEDKHYIADGRVTLEDVYRFFPVPYTIAKGKVDGARLKSIMESNLTAVFSRDSFKQHGGWADGWSGLDAQVDLNAPDGHKIRKISLSSSGKPLELANTFTIAGCQRPLDGDDILCSYKGFKNVEPLRDPTNGMPWYVQDLFVHLLRNNGIDSSRSMTRIHDVTDTAVWPSTPYVQPVWE